MGKGPTVFVRRSRPRVRREIEDAVRRQGGRWLSQNLSESDKLDILMDSSPDADRKEVSGILASKLPDGEVLAAIDKMNRYTDGSDEMVKRGKKRRKR